MKLMSATGGRLVDDDIVGGTEGRRILMEGRRNFHPAYVSVKTPTHWLTINIGDDGGGQT